MELQEGHFDLAGALADALGGPRALRGCSGGLPGTLRERPGRSRGGLGDPPGRPRESADPLLEAFSIEISFRKQKRRNA